MNKYINKIKITITDFRCTMFKILYNITLNNMTNNIKILISLFFFFNICLDTVGLIFFQSSDNSVIILDLKADV